MPNAPLFSIITPSRGDRPRALAQAIDSVARAAAHAGLTDNDLEMLVGFDGVKGERVGSVGFVRWFDLPKSGNFGNGLRDILLRVSRGRRVLLVDDDNALTETALATYQAHPEPEMLIGRVDCRLAFDREYLPEGNSPEAAVRQCNIDPLCLCLSRELVADRCGGWRSEGGYESDFLNIRRYHRRARSVLLLDALVGVYDAGRGLDEAGLNDRQRGLPAGDGL